MLTRNRGGRRRLVLHFSKGDQWIHTRRPPRGNVTRQKRDSGKNGRRSTKRERVTRTDAEQKGSKQARQANGTGEPQDEPDEREYHSIP